MSPVLWVLIGATVVTVGLLFERRKRSRPLSLDEWALAHHRPVLREIPLSVLAEIEPVALLPFIVSIERFLPAPSEDGTALFLCQCGPGHRPLHMLLAVASLPSGVPHARVLPKTVRDVPAELGFSEQDATGLPAAYRIEAFSPLETALVHSIGLALPAAGTPIRIELRPGRLLVAIDETDGEAATALCRHAEAIRQALLAEAAPS